MEALPDVVVFQANVEPPGLEEIARALRYPDVSVVLDLSSLGHASKVSFVEQLLPLLASLRRQSGLPHWVVVDEAHYFLRRPEAARALDAELAAYVLVTYQPSQLHPALMGAVESCIVTPFTHPGEIDALAGACGADSAPESWDESLGNLAIDEAVLINRTATIPRLTHFKIAERITSHVRHRNKYIDVPMALEHAFVFTCDGQTFGPPARTLKQFVWMQERVPRWALEAHAQRGDFSRWIREVFGDAPLAAAVRRFEQEVCQGTVIDSKRALSKLVRERYALQESVPPIPVAA